MTTPILLPISTTMWAGLGYAYGRLTQVPPGLAAQVFAISEIADSIFYFLASLAAKNDHEKKATYALTNLFVNAGTVIAMKHLNFIAKTGLFLFTGLTILTFLNRIAETESTYIISKK